MKKHISVIILTLAGTAFAQSPSQLWLYEETSPPPASRTLVAVATDASGGSVTLHESGLNPQFLIRKHNATGAIVWTRTFGTLIDQRPQALALDASGNVIVAGHGALDALTSSVFILKYNAAGDLLWSESFGVPAALDHVHDIAADAAGNVFVCGYLSPDPPFNSGGIYARKMSSSSGALLWQQIVTSTATTATRSRLCLDYLGNVIVTTTRADGADAGDCFTVKHDSGGVFQWQAVYDNNGAGGDITDEADDVVTDAAGNVYVSASSQRISGSDNRDAVIIKYSSAGLERYARRFDGPAHEDERPSTLAVNSGGTVIHQLIGSRPTTAFGSTFSFAVLRYDAAGLLWSASPALTTSQDVHLPDLIIDPLDGNAIVAGTLLSGLGDEQFASEKFSALGVSMWQKLVGQPGRAFVAGRAAITYGGTFVVAGVSGSAVLKGAALVRLAPPGDAPITQTAYATSTTAQLFGALDPQGLPTTYQFEYGTTAMLGTTTPVRNALADYDQLYATSENISGLTPGGTYHYRIMVTNALGTTYGATLTFLANSPPLPVNRTLYAQAGVPLAFTLTGDDPENDPLTFSFNPPPLPIHGILTGTPPALTYTPHPGNAGSWEYISFYASDGLHELPTPDMLTIRIVSATQDDDNDQMPDLWEFQNFGTVSNGPNQDADGDGFTNLQEWLADTHPAQASSFLKTEFAGPVNPGGPVEITLANVRPGVRYRFQRNSVLSNPLGWITLESVTFPTAHTDHVFTDVTPPPGAAFYRVELTLEP